MPIFDRSTQLARQEHAFSDDLWVPRVRLLEHGIQWRLHAGARKTLEVVFVDRLSFGRRRPNAKEFRTAAQAGRRLVEE